MPAPGPNTLDIARQTKVYRGAAAQKGSVVVNGPASGECQLPAAAGAGSIAGVLADDVTDGQEVALTEHAYEKVRIAGATPIFARLEIADAQGRVRALAGAGGSAANVVGVLEEAGTQADQRVVANLKTLGTRQVV